jgi:hypothetical protein
VAAQGLQQLRLMRLLASGDSTLPRPLQPVLARQQLPAAAPEPTRRCCLLWRPMLT